VPYADLVALRSTAEARKHGKLRSEGKAYAVKDGDVIEVLFSR
jgi:ribosome-binding ATPase YchF (GTP1/OBG family)